MCLAPTLEWSGFKSGQTIAFIRSFVSTLFQALSQFIKLSCVHIHWLNDDMTKTNAAEVWLYKFIYNNYEELLTTTTTMMT